MVQVRNMYCKEPMRFCESVNAPINDLISKASIIITIAYIVLYIYVHIYSDDLCGVFN